MQWKHLVTAAGAAALVCGTATAKVSSEEAAKLGKELTPIGAEKAANADGTIPEWTGGLPKLEITEPKHWDNPWPDEKPLFTITKDNVDKYKDKLTVTHLALFDAYGDTYKMNVYPTRRSSGFPDEYYEYTKKNATTAELEGTDLLKNAEVGFPFPIPKTGAEVIWNHRLKYRGKAVQRFNNQFIVQADGSSQKATLIEDVLFPYANLSDDHTVIDDKDDVTIYYVAEILSPPRNAGLFLMAWEHVDYRSAWLYPPALRRVRRAPSVAYDNPYEGTDGNQFYDQVDMYNGALDRFTWKLKGKKEYYLPVNSFAMNEADVKYDDVIGTSHINQDLPRYELRRAWVVEAELKDGTTHKFGKRRFYVDEDSWNVVVVDCYDTRGNLWKLQEGHLIVERSLPASTTVPEIIYDLQARSYFATALRSEDKPNNQFVEYDTRYFDPRELKRRATR